MTSFHDLFSQQSAAYAQFRPEYPRALYEALLPHTVRRDRAWDCACGSGQAGSALAEWFGEVVATDASEAQLHNAATHPRVRYVVARAERAPLRDASIDLTVVAQALHWFRVEEFYAELRRVSRPGAVFATWAYAVHRSADTDVDRALQELAHGRLAPYWATENRRVWNGYRDVPFPFTPVPVPVLEHAVEWSLPELLGYLDSWSARVTLAQVEGERAWEEALGPLIAAWGDPAGRRRLVSPFVLKAGIVG